MYGCTVCTQTFRFARYAGSAVAQPAYMPTSVGPAFIVAFTDPGTSTMVVSKPICPHCGADLEINPPREI